MVPGCHSTGETFFNCNETREPGILVNIEVTEETCEEKSSEQKSERKFRNADIYMNSENPEIQNPGKSSRSSVWPTWIDSLCYFRHLQMVQNIVPGRHSAYEINFCCTESRKPAEIEVGEEICERKRSKYSKRNFENPQGLHEKWKPWNSKFELTTLTQLLSERKKQRRKFNFQSEWGRFREESWIILEEDCSMTYSD